MKKTNIDIGIPAYNEQENIGKLLDSLLSQRGENILIKNIIVFSDGSTDKTNQIVEKYKSKKIKLIKSSKRNGQAIAQNQIFKIAASDILVLLNADIKINESDFIYKLSSPIIKSPAVGLTGAKTVPVKSISFFENIISKSHLEKNRLYESLLPGNIYLCHGRARAFSKRLYKSFKFPKIIAEDAYSYLINKQKGFKFNYVKNAKVYFRSPTNLNDHLKQSLRFKDGLSGLVNNFGTKVIKQEFYIPLVKKMSFFGHFIYKYPVYGLGYLIVMLISKMAGKKGSRTSHIWSSSASSKKV